jgi:hypothetical protein
VWARTYFARCSACVGGTGTALQLIFVIGDGRVDKERSAVQTLIRQAAEKGQMCATIMIDTPTETAESVFKRKVGLTEDTLRCLHRQLA